MHTHVKAVCKKEACNKEISKDLGDRCLLSNFIGMLKCNSLSMRPGRNYYNRQVW